ncbi:MAG TPA: hypothetical protein VFE62_00390 [Gemmataceae bacterium]|nr:hypothetical protein [Gemmataceae bacterium]
MKVQLQMIRDAIALAHRLVKELQNRFKRDSAEFDSLYEIELGLEWTLKRVDHLDQRTANTSG